MMYMPSKKPEQLAMCCAHNDKALNEASYWLMNNFFLVRDIAMIDMRILPTISVVAYVQGLSSKSAGILSTYDAGTHSSVVTKLSIGTHLKKFHNFTTSCSSL